METRTLHEYDQWSVIWRASSFFGKLEIYLSLNDYDITMRYHIQAKLSLQDL